MVFNLQIEKEQIKLKIIQEENKDKNILEVCN